MGDYYPFGMVMPGRSYSSQSGYRYGFNGKENDTEYGSGGLTQDYGFRMYNPAIAKFLSVDPLAPEYPWYTPYQFAGNMPILAVDLDGMEPKFPATSAYQVAEAPLIGSDDGVTHTWIANADKTWTWVCPEVQVADYRYDEGEIRGDKNGWTSKVWHQGGVVVGANVSEAGWYTFDDYERIIRTLAPKIDYLECGNPNGFNGDLLYGAETTESAFDEISTFLASREFCAEGSGDNYFDKALSDARTGYETTKAYKLTGSGHCEPMYCEDMFLGGAGLLRRILTKGLAAGAAKGTSILAEASDAAFKAADDVGSIFIKNKHLSCATGNYSKFATTEISKAQGWVQQALRSPNARFLPNDQIPNTFQVVTDLGTTIGTKGQTSIRVIVGFDGKVINAFPIK